MLLALFSLSLMLIGPTLQDGCCKSLPAEILVGISTRAAKNQGRTASRHQRSGPTRHITCSNVNFTAYSCSGIDIPIVDHFDYMEITDSQIPEIPSDAFIDFDQIPVLNLRINNQSVETIKPNAFEIFTHLKYLSLDHNKIMEIGKNSFGNCTSLNTLKLAANRITTIETGAFDSLIGLYELDLSSNSLSALNGSIFAKCVYLNILYLMDNKFVVIQRDFFNELPKLYQLDLSRNRIKHIDPDAFISNVNLGSIDLSYNDLENITSLNLPKSCRTFNLNHNKLNVMNLTDLRYAYSIDLSFSSFAFDEESIPASEMATTTLILNHTLQFSGDHTLSIPKSFKNLRSLSLNSNNLSDFDVSSLEPIKELTNLKLDDNVLSVLDLTSVSDKLKFLYLRRNALRTISGLTHLSNLTVVDLGWNAIEVVTVNMFERLKNMKELFLNNNKINKLEMGCFRDVQNLTIIDLSNNQLTVLEPGIFGDAILTHVRLSNNLLSDLHQGVLQNDKHLLNLDLSHNRLKYTPSVRNLLKHITNNRLYDNKFTLDVSGNDWNCDDLLEIIREDNITSPRGNQSNVTNIKGIACETTTNQTNHYRGIAFSDYDEDDNRSNNHIYDKDDIIQYLLNRLTAIDSLILLLLFLLAIALIIKGLIFTFRRMKVFYLNT